MDKFQDAFQHGSMIKEAVSEMGTDDSEWDDICWAVMREIYNNPKHPKRGAMFQTIGQQLYNYTMRYVDKTDDECEHVRDNQNCCHKCGEDLSHEH